VLILIWMGLYKVICVVPMYKVLQKIFTELVIFRQHTSNPATTVELWLLHSTFARHKFLDFGYYTRSLNTSFSWGRGTCHNQLCLFWLSRAVDFKVSCSQIPCRVFAGIRTHDPLVEIESDVPTIRPRRSTKTVHQWKRCMRIT
jgi:hypothetical protein